MAARLCALPGAASTPHHYQQRGALRRPMLPGPGLGRARQALGQGKCTCSAAVADAEVEETAFHWKGADQFTELDDRKDVQPLALPAVSAPLRVVLVRHGQSTWNASGRIQGSSDFAVLTPKGEAQADTTRQMVRCHLACGALPVPGQLGGFEHSIPIPCHACRAWNMAHAAAAGGGPHALEACSWRAIASAACSTARWSERRARLR